MKITSSGAGISAELSVDVYVGGASFSISNFSVGYGITDKGLCLSNIGISYSILDLKLDACLSVAFTGSKISIGGSLNFCADPCEVISCAVCKKVGVSLSKDIPEL